MFAVPPFHILSTWEHDPIIVPLIFTFKTEMFFKYTLATNPLCCINNMYVFIRSRSNLKFNRVFNHRCGVSQSQVSKRISSASSYYEYKNRWHHQIEGTQLCQTPGQVEIIDYNCNLLSTIKLHGDSIAKYKIITYHKYARFGFLHTRCMENSILLKCRFVLSGNSKCLSVAIIHPLKLHCYPNAESCARYPHLLKLRSQVIFPNLVLSFCASWLFTPMNLPPVHPWH